MVQLRTVAAILASQAVASLATPMIPFLAPAPTVRLDDATFSGFTSGKTEQFLGIPFAYPPTGDRRFRLPEPLLPYQGFQKATAFGPSCPQQPMVLPSWVNSALSKVLNSIVSTMYKAVTPESEDCLTINVVKPASANPNSKLPVVVWFFGGGFEIGGTATYDGGGVVQRSIDLKQPIIYVSMNYRLTALGFLPGKEVKEAGVGNLGLQDQRLALRWVRKYIQQFGGDPDKVTIWGESAGAISVSLQMITNGGNSEGLFRGAIMQSGGPIPVGDITHGQNYYDDIVMRTGCERSKDTLQCLREVPFTTLKGAIDQSPNFFAYQGLVLAWLPRVDGVFLTAPPQHLVLQGSVANVPFISGNCDDEGSLFSISTINLTTTRDTHEYLKTYMLPSATDDQLDLMLRYYPDDPRQGCPFDTGLENAISPQFKRVAAIQGDVVFHGPRRFFLKNLANKQKAWAFVSKRAKDTPFVGSAHATDLLNSFGIGEMKDYVIRFTNNLDPNGRTGLGIPWPQYDPSKPKALIFQDSSFFPLKIADDNYREKPLEFAINMSLIHPI